MIKNKFNIKQRVFFIEDSDKLRTSMVKSIFLNVKDKKKNSIIYQLENQTVGFNEKDLYSKREEAKKVIKKYYEGKIKELN
jgi:hypothetical protein